MHFSDINVLFLCMVLSMWTTLIQSNDNDNYLNDISLNLEDVGYEGDAYDIGYNPLGSEYGKEGHLKCVCSAGSVKLFRRIENNIAKKLLAQVMEAIIHNQTIRLYPNFVVYKDCTSCEVSHYSCNTENTKCLRRMVEFNLVPKEGNETNKNNSTNISEPSTQSFSKATDIPIEVNKNNSTNVSEPSTQSFPKETNIPLGMVEINGVAEEGNEANKNNATNIFEPSTQYFSKATNIPLEMDKFNLVSKEVNEMVEFNLAPGERNEANKNIATNISEPSTLYFSKATNIPLGMVEIDGVPEEGNEANKNISANISEPSTQSFSKATNIPLETDYNNNNNSTNISEPSTQSFSNASDIPLEANKNNSTNISEPSTQFFSKATDIPIGGMVSVDDTNIILN